jgi:NAD(P)-dependent dehydrogenase (short-subunit alcohol dehydrogenase family)
VTGASGGVGRATARAFAARGDTVVLLARGEAGLNGAARDVEAVGGTPVVIPVDTADYLQVFEAAERVERDTGPIDVWVNDAFTSVFARFDEIKPEEFRRVTEVSYLGYVYGTMAALSHMKPRNRGTIVQVGSALAYRGIPLQSAYCGAKHAIQGFNESLRCELLHDRSGVRVTMVQLPAVNTPQFDWVKSRLPHHAQPVPPIYQPEVVAGGILYAADHPRRREYWIGASTAATLLANAVAPGLLDRYLARTGFRSQQTREPEDPAAPANLWEPVDGAQGHDFGAHGEFDDRSVNQAPQLWASHHHGVLGAACAAVAFAPGRAHHEAGEPVTRPRTAVGLAVVISTLGATLMVRPEAVVPPVPAPLRRRVMSVARIMGIRILVQTAAMLVWPNRRVYEAGALVDGAHAGTMLCRRRPRPGYRRVALTSAAAASASAVATCVVRRRVRT